MSVLCAYWARVLTRAFAREELNARGGSRLWRHLGRCESCRGDYNRLVRMQRLWESHDKTSAQPVSLELGLWRDRVVASAGLVKSKRGLWAGVLAGTAVAAAVVFIAVQPPAARSRFVPSRLVGRRSN